MSCNDVSGVANYKARSAAFSNTAPELKLLNPAVNYYKKNDEYENDDTKRKKEEEYANPTTLNDQAAIWKFCKKTYLNNLLYQIPNSEDEGVDV